MTPSRRIVRRSAAAALLLAVSLASAGCTQLLSAFNGEQSVALTPEPAADAAASGTASTFASTFTDEGSVALTTDVADDLEVRIEAWAVDPKRTQEWTLTGDKAFGFAVNVYDYRVSEKAVLTDKRRVYLSRVSITSQLAPSQASGPLQFSADPRTLVPTDTLRSDRGLLLNSFQGGLLVPTTTVPSLPAGTTGITLRFELTLSTEGTANDDGSFSEQTITQDLPIEIFADASAG